MLNDTQTFSQRMKARDQPWLITIWRQCLIPRKQQSAIQTNV